MTSPDSRKAQSSPSMPGIRAVRSTRRELAVVLAIGAVSGLIRLVVASEYVRSSLGRFPWVDEASYWTWAQSIARGEWLPVRPFYQDPLYPYWLSLLIRVAGADVAGLRLISAGLGAITPMMVAWVGRRTLGPAQGLVAGWALAFCGPLILADCSLEKEGLAASGSALALGLVAWSDVARRQAAGLVRGGGVLGAGRTLEEQCPADGGGRPDLDVAPRRTRPRPPAPLEAGDRLPRRFRRGDRAAGPGESRRLPARGMAGRDLAVGAELLHRQRPRGDGHLRRRPRSCGPTPPSRRPTSPPRRAGGPAGG